MRAAAESGILKSGKFIAFLCCFISSQIVSNHPKYCVLGCSVHHLCMYAVYSSAFLCVCVSVCVYAHVCIFVLLRDALFLASPRSSAAAPPPTISGAPVSLASPVVPVPLIRGLALQRTTRQTVQRPEWQIPPNLRQLKSPAKYPCLSSPLKHAKTQDSVQVVSLTPLQQGSYFGPFSHSLMTSS